MEGQHKTLAKKRGRPATGEGLTVGVRCHQPLLDKIDNWRRVQSDIPNRAESIRRLVELGLKAKGRK